MTRSVLSPSRRQLLLATGGALGLLGAPGHLFGADADPAATPPAPTPTMPPGFVPDGEAEIVKVMDGDSATLATGQDIRLLGILAPAMADGKRLLNSRPYAEAARDRLSEQALHKTVRFGRAGGPLMDRYGRGLVHLVRDDGLWLQGWMVVNGHARVYGQPDSRAFLPELLALERTARAAKRGLWALSTYAVRDAAKPIRPLGAYQLVEGTVAGVLERDGWVYINFGADWKTDFTAYIGPDTRRAFASDWPAFQALTGKRLRVRGWVYLRAGPAVDITYPEQIEMPG